MAEATDLTRLKVIQIVLLAISKILIIKPADILMPNWVCSRPPTAFDFAVISPLNPTLTIEVVTTAGSAAMSASQVMTPNVVNVTEFVS